MRVFTIRYDREGDWLEVLFDDTPAYLEEVREDVFERRTPQGRIVGLTVFNFSKQDRSVLTLPLTAVPAP